MCSSVRDRAIGQGKFLAGGHWVYISTSKTNRREAQRMLDFKIELAGAGKLATNASFEQTIDLLLNDARVRGLWSVPRMARAGRALLAQLESLRAKDVTHSKLIEYAANRQGRGIAPDTVKLEMDVARRTLKLAQREGWITALPEFPSIKHLCVRAGFFGPEQWRQVRERLRPDLRDAADFALLTG